MFFYPMKTVVRENEAGLMYPNKGKAKQARGIQRKGEAGLMYPNFRFFMAPLRSKMHHFELREGPEIYFVREVRFPLGGSGVSKLEVI